MPIEFFVKATRGRSRPSLHLSVAICVSSFMLGCGDLSVSTSTTQSSSALASLPACSEGQVQSADCQTSSGQIVTSTQGANVNGTNGSLTANIPAGYYSGAQMCSMSDTSLTASNIKSGATIFGVAGNYAESFNTNMASSALRDPGTAPVANHGDIQSTSSQISLASEVTTYAGTDLPSGGADNYRDIPDDVKDDEGYIGTSCKYAPRPASDCGTSQSTIAARIADCATQNPSTSSWDGATQCNRGQGLWKLVTRSGSNKEVWQDQRTGLIWSSAVSTGINWCQATGATSLAPVTYYQSYNTAAGTPITGNGSIGTISGGSSSAGETITITFTSATNFTVSGTCGTGGSVDIPLTATPGATSTYSRANYCSFTITQGSTNFVANDKFELKSTTATSYSCAPGAASLLQPASPISYCAEATGLNPPAGETWSPPAYVAAKGGMGKLSTPAVRWRAPSIEDYKLADVNGIRFVMPDMGIAGASRPTPDTSLGTTAYEWSSSVFSGNRYASWYFFGATGLVSNVSRIGSVWVRCVGR